MTALAVAEAVRAASRGLSLIGRIVQTYQAAAILLSQEYLPQQLEEQGIDPTPDEDVFPAALLTPVRDMVDALDRLETEQEFEQIVATLTADARRTAREIDAFTRPAVTGYTRRVTLPCCSRCAILAGRVYRWSEGFPRHPGCDCDPVATDDDAGQELVEDPSILVERGLITDLSKAEQTALDLGADLSRVVNVKRKAAGLRQGSSVMQRAGRLTPHGCIEFGSDRDDTMRLLRRYGYIT